jgi:UDP-glucuronate 4-epimerase
MLNVRSVLVTGAAGFIGSNLSEALLARGMRVVGLDDINDYYNPAWKRQNVTDLQQHARFTFVEGDILDETLLQQVCKDTQFDAIVHLAARAGVRPSIANPKLYESVNIRGTLNILELAKNCKIPKVVFASSSSVYGNRKDTPFSEEDRVDFPISPYAATKKACEEMAYAYSHLHNISCVGLRFFTAYGPKGRPDMAPYLFTEALLTGQPIKRFGVGDSGRDYTYIDDIVHGVANAMEYDTKFDIFNLGNSSPVMLNDFIAMLERITDKTALVKELPKQQGDVDVTYANISKAQKLLSYNPTTSLEAGLTEFVAWYIKHRGNQIAYE